MSSAFEYKIVVGTASEVEKQVTDLTEGGWILHGALIYTTTGEFAQALIKEFERRGAWG